MSLTHAGIVHQPPGQSTLAYLPLEKVAINAWMVDVSARLVLTQVFQNESDRPTARAKYVFPLPERSAVCGFELEHADGRVIVGVVKESEDAARTFEVAVAAGQTAALVERVTDDIFTISVGSIPARKHVTTRIMFIMDLLTEGMRDHVRLQLPLAIFERYGPTPDSMIDAASATILYSHRYQSRRPNNPTHLIKVSRYKTRNGRKSQRRMSASWASPTFEKRDFVLTVYADGLDKPRCFAEIDTEAGTGTIGMQLTLVPSFEVPRNPSQEYLFVIDISGSMQGDRVETAKCTLLMLLRLLPCSQTTFNVFRFGSEVYSLWAASCDYNQDSVDKATTHVKSLKADGGGTEIAKALRAAINSRRNDRPTAIFLLTDGQIEPMLRVQDSGNTTNIVAEAVRRTSPQAPLRVFVLGIADATSSMCEGIARAGNGECLFAVSHEQILGKCARLLNAGRTKKIESIEVDWGSLPTSTATHSTHAVSSRLALQQIPHSLTKIFAGLRFTVFAIISPGRVPSSIKLLTKFDGVDEPMEWDVPVTEVKPFKDAECEIPLIHTLAVRKLITEFSEGRTPLPAVVGSVVASEDEIKKAAIVRLGLGYQLAKVLEEVKSRPDTGWIRTRRQLRSRRSMQQTEQNEGVNEEENDGLLDTVFNGFTSAISWVLGMFSGSASGPNPGLEGPQNLPGSYTDSELSPDTGDGDLRGRTTRPREQDIPRRYSTDTACSFPEFVRDVGSPPVTRATVPQVSIPSRVTSTTPPTISKEAYEVFQLIEPDGSFPPSPQLGQIIGPGISEKAAELGVDGKLWATMVAVAYLKKCLENEPNLLDALVAKAEDFIREAQANGQALGTSRLRAFHKSKGTANMSEPLPIASSCFELWNIWPGKLRQLMGISFIRHEGGASRALPALRFESPVSSPRCLATTRISNTGFFLNSLDVKILVSSKAHSRDS
ncbi:hypothetical protein BKA82DRAFT_4017369 [Pisolithus tinctorius]|nr:hypothetical protein BKA82DRAFT_4017369 [Pisolithus tinctorius]